VGTTEKFEKGEDNRLPDGKRRHDKGRFPRFPLEKNTKEKDRLTKGRTKGNPYRRPDKAEEVWLNLRFPYNAQQAEPQRGGNIDVVPPVGWYGKQWKGTPKGYNVGTMENTGKKNGFLTKATERGWYV